jgi:flagellar FliL protein
MSTSKPITVTLLIITILSLLTAAGLFFYYNLSNQSQASDKLSADEILELSIDTKEITTNLADDSYVKIRFNVQVDNKKAKQELEKRIFQLQNAIIYELSSVEKDDLRGKKGISELETRLGQRIDEFLENGNVSKVYTTQKIIQ